MRAPFTCVAAVLLVSLGLAANAQDNLTISYSLPGDAVVIINDPTLGLNNVQTWSVPFTGVLTYPDNTQSNPFNCYCVDLNHGQYSNVTQTVTVSTVTPTSNTSTTNPSVNNTELSEASWLIQTYGNIAGAPGNAAFDSQQAALQLAIWGVVSGDTGFNTAGYSLANQYVGGVQQNFWMSGLDATLANAELASVGTHLGDGTLYALNPQNNRGPDSGQNVLRGGLYPSTPEGSTLAMLAFGLAPLGFGWFKRRRATS